MTPAEKFSMWLSIYDMEDYAPEMVPSFTAMAELMDFMVPPKWVLDEAKKEKEHRAGDH